MISFKTMQHIFAFLLISTITAQSFSIQGVLRDPLGRTVEDGFYAMSFKIYEQAAGGDVLWEETHGSVEVQHGVYIVELGLIETMNELTFDIQYYIGISIGDGEELQPRMKVTSSPSSFGVFGVENSFPSVGNVGVGTTEPTASLHIVSDENVPKGLVIETSDGTEFLTVTQDGKMGIGVSEPNDPLSINGNLRLQGGGAVLFDDGTQLASANFGGSATGIASPGTVSISAATDEPHTGDIYFNINESTAMTIANNGNVGIGTDDPIATFEVQNNNDNGVGIHSMNNSGKNTAIIEASSMNESELILQSGESFSNVSYSDSTDDLSIESTGIKMQTAGSIIDVDTQFNVESSDIFLDADNVIINENGGNVGIGVSNPDVNLEVASQMLVEGTWIEGSGSGIGHTTLAHNARWNNGMKAIHGYSDNNDGVNYPSSISMENEGHIYFRTSEDENINAGDPVNLENRMTITRDGKVGIKTTSPDYTLHVSGSAKVNSQTALGLDEGANVGIGTDSPDRKLTVQGNAEISGQTALGLDSNANVGIGTDSPDRKLTVEGDAIISGQTVLGLDEGANVGVGTENPDEKLHIESGNLLVRGTWIEGSDEGTGHAAFGHNVRWNNGWKAIHGYSDNTAGFNYPSMISMENEGRIDFRTSTNENIDAGDPVALENRMRITKEGNVGIGTDSPDRKLTVEGNAEISGQTALGLDEGANVGIGTEDPQRNLHVMTDSAATGDDAWAMRIQLAEGSSASPAFWDIGIDNEMGNQDLVFNHYGSFTFWPVDLDTLEHWGGWCRFDNSDGSYHHSSDRRIKKNIEQVQNILDKVLQLKPSYFNMKSEQNPNQKRIGFIAQDVQEVFPELSTVGHHGDMLGLSYSDFGVMAVAAIQEQQQIIETMEMERAQEITDLKKMIEDLQKQLSELKK